MRITVRNRREKRQRREDRFEIAVDVSDLNPWEADSFIEQVRNRVTVRSIEKAQPEQRRRSPKEPIIIFLDR